MSLYTKLLDLKKNIPKTDVTIQEVITPFEEEIIQLQEANLNLMRNIRSLETQLKFYQKRLEIIEGIKIDEKSKNNLWKIIAIVSILFGLLSWIIN